MIFRDSGGESRHAEFSDLQKFLQHLQREPLYLLYFYSHSRRKRHENEQQQSQGFWWEELVTESPGT